MDLKIIVCLLTILTVAELRSPQVHEEIDETSNEHISDNQRFNYEANQQRDMQKWRYLQQQAVDARHQARNAAQTPKPTLKTHKKRDVGSSGKNRVSKDASREYFFFDESKSLDDNEQIQMLNSLVGQAPVLQLQGLQKLLSMKDHTPVMENVVDVVNPVDFPNVKAEPAPPEYQEAVANAYVLEADKQRKIKEQLGLSGLDRFKVPLPNGHQLPHSDIEEYGPKIHPTYGPIFASQEKPEHGIYDVDKENLQYAANYAFGYQVRDFDSGNDFGHEEVASGLMRKGRYHVLLPDGRLQNVQYWADHSGFHAKVTYDKVAVHPSAN